MARRSRNAFSFSLLGTKDLMDAFDQLPKAVGVATLRRAAVKALAPVRDLAISLAAVSGDGTPQLRDSIAVSTQLSRGQKRKAAKTKGMAIAYVGPSAPKGSAGILVEFGTGARYTKAGAYRGQVSPKPFLRPAWDSKKDEVLAQFKTEVWKELAKSAKRLRRKAEKGKLGKAARRHLGGW